MVKKWWLSKSLPQPLVKEGIVGLTKKHKNLNINKSNTPLQPLLRWREAPPSGGVERHPIRIMKQTYMTPAVEELNIETVEIIASSIPVGDGEGDAVNVIGRRGVWGDRWAD